MTTRQQKKSSRKPARPDFPRVDLYQQVTDKIVLAIEKGTLPWRKPWRTHSSNPGTQLSNLMPVNALTGRQYSGINVLLLWLSAEERGYRSDRWLTFKQALDAGGQVRKGETATMAVIYKDWTKQAEDLEGNRLCDSNGTPQMETVPMLRHFMLFNVEQCDGLPESISNLPDGEDDTLKPEDIDDTGALSETVLVQVLTILDACGVKFSLREQDRAYYRSSVDEIVMPLPVQFFYETDYWATLLHETVHATGHAKRLNREGITSASRQFGDPVYAFEELIAEMGSAFLCAQLGINGEAQHDSYIEHWLGQLKSDKKALFRACRFAREASEYLLAPTVSQPDAVCPVNEHTA